MSKQRQSFIDDCGLIKSSAFALSGRMLFAANEQDPMNGVRNVVELGLWNAIDFTVIGSEIMDR